MLELETLFSWFKDNQMIVNRGKVQAIIFHKYKGDHTNQIINIDQKESKAVSKFNFLGLEIEDKLNSTTTSTTFVNLPQTN